MDSFANVRKQSAAPNSLDSLFPMEVDVSNKKTISAIGMQSCVVTVEVAVVVNVVVSVAVWVEVAVLDCVVLSVDDAVVVPVELIELVTVELADVVTDDVIVVVPVVKHATEVNCSRTDRT